MSLARAKSRGRRLKARFGVNGIQKDSKSFGMGAKAAVITLSRHGRTVPAIRVCGLTIHKVVDARHKAGRAAAQDRLPPYICAGTTARPKTTQKQKWLTNPINPTGSRRGCHADSRTTRRARSRRPGMIDRIRAVYELYGFEPVETPAIEYTDALGKFLPDQDRPNEGVFSFLDDDEQWLSLRYDLTAPLARYVAENFDTLPKPYRSYRVGYVFRNEKPGPGRFRQFMQFDADTVGSSSPAADAEMCMMAADT